MASRRTLFTVTAAVCLSATALGSAVAAPASVGSDSTIIGGEVSTKNPGAVALFENGKFFCSGSQIAPEWVMTARHCLAATGTITARMGSLKSASGGVTGTVTKKVSHPKLSGGRQPDVGLLKLDKSVKDTPLVKIGTQRPKAGTVLIGMGWGYVREGADPSPDLKEAKVKVIKYSENDNDNGGGLALRVSPVKGMGAPGDSGGPAFLNGEQVGLWSSGDLPLSKVNGRLHSLSQTHAWVKKTAGIS